MDPVVLRAMDPGPPRAHSNPNKESKGDVDSNSACSLVCNGSFPIYGNNGKQTDRLYYIATARSLATTSSDYERRGSFSSQHIFVSIPLISLHQSSQSEVFADVLSL